MRSVNKSSTRRLRRSVWRAQIQTPTQRSARHRSMWATPAFWRRFPVALAKPLVTEGALVSQTGGTQLALIQRDRHAVCRPEPIRLDSDEIAPSDERRQAGMINGNVPVTIIFGRWQRIRHQRAFAVHRFERQRKHRSSQFARRSAESGWLADAGYVCSGQNSRKRR